MGRPIFKITLLICVLGSFQKVLSDDGQSYLDAISANLNALKQFDVSFTHSLAGLGINKETSEPQGTDTIDSEVKARLIMDRVRRNFIFAVVERRADTSIETGISERKKSNVKAQIGNPEARKGSEGLDASISVYSYSQDGGEGELGGYGNANAARSKVPFEEFHRRYRIPLVEYAGIQFPAVLENQDLNSTNEKFNMAYLGCECRRLPGARVQLQRIDEKGGNQFSFTLVIDPRSMMPVSTTVVESDKKGTKPDIVHARQSAKYKDFNGIFLPVEVGFENRDYGAKGKVFGTFGTIQIQWQNVNQEIAWESMPKLTSEIEILRFIDAAKR